MLPHIHHLIHLQALGYLVRDEDHRHLALEAVDGLGEVFSAHAAILHVSSFAALQHRKR